MRVLHVLHELQPSGAETCLAVAGPAWTAQGITADVLATGPTRGPYAPALQAAGFRVGHLPLDPFRRFVPRYLRLLRRGRYDAVHVHVERGNFYLAVLARLAGAGTLLQSVHAMFDFEGPLRLQRTVQRALMRLLGVRFLAVSDHVADNERRRFANPTTLLPNWYDPGRFHEPSIEERAAARSAHGLEAGDFAVVSVGNCHPVKNHDALLRAVAGVEDRALVYLHAGTGEPEPKERALAGALGIADRVRFLGRVDDVPAVLAAADCFVMPSTFEGLGIAAVEALATGVPAVLADVPGLSSLRPVAQGSRWVEPSVDGLRSALLAMMATPPGERAATAAAGARAVAAAYAPDRPVAWLARLYGAAAAGSGRPSVLAGAGRSRP